MLVASRLEGIDGVRALIEAGADVNACSDSGETSLGIASGGDGSEAKVTALIGAGARVNVHDEEGKTALIIACEKGKGFSKVCALINSGADVNVRDTQGRTALMIASANGSVARQDFYNQFFGDCDEDMADVERCKALIQAGADVNARDIHGWTPLMGASSKNDVRVVKFLIQSGARVNVRNKDGRTALMIASEQEVIDVLSQAGDTSCVGS